MLPRKTGSIYIYIFFIIGPNEAVSHWERMSHLCVCVCVLVCPASFVHSVTVGIII